MSAANQAGELNQVAFRKPFRRFRKIVPQIEFMQIKNKKPGLDWTSTGF